MDSPSNSSGREVKDQSTKPELLFSPSYPQKETLEKLQKRRRKNLIIIGAILLILLGITILETQYIQLPSLAFIALFNLNIVLLILLILLIFRNLFKLFMERKQRHIGSHFRTKLVVGFIVMSMLPTALLAFIGSNLMADSIKNWFNPQVNEFIDDAMDVARTSHAAFESFADEFARSLSTSITTQELLEPAARDALERLMSSRQTEMNLELIQLFDSKSNEVWRGALRELPSGVLLESQTQELKEILEGNSFFKTRLLGDGDLIQHGIPVYSLKSPDKIEGALIVNLFLEQSVSQKIRAIQRNYEAYKQQGQMIQPTQGLYISIFILIALTILFAAIWLALYMARQISIPISHLAQATHEVAKGNLEYKLDILAYDEIGSLVRSFNGMTEQLRANRSLIEKTTGEIRKSNLEIVERRNQLETILRHIAAGVISIDAQGVLRTVNEAAAKLLEVDESEILLKHYNDAFGRDTLQEFRNLLDRICKDRYHGFQRELHIRTSQKVATCSVNFATLFDINNQFNGVVIVLDDLTQFLRIQRIAAWREVARRLAHEIKNPLTPIQLNAQRMQKKYRQNAEDFPKIFTEGTDTIINEVNGLRLLLNEFSQFARMPEASLRPGDLHDVLNQTIGLYAGSNEGVEIQVHLEEKMPPVMIDPEQIKRVFINLIDNASEAMNNQGIIQISTEYDPVFGAVRIHINDEGSGVPLEDKDKLFLPYYSTKGRGSGLGLAICNRIISDHDGSIRVHDNEPQGTRITVELPVRHEGLYQRFGTSTERDKGE